MSSAAAAVDQTASSYRRLHIYTTKARLYVVGCDEASARYRILKLRRQDGSLLDAVESSQDYDAEEANSILAAIHENSGGLQLVCKVSPGSSIDTLSHSSAILLECGGLRSTTSSLPVALQAAVGVPTRPPGGGWQLAAAASGHARPHHPYV